MIDPGIGPGTGTDCVYWRVDGPGLPVTASIQTSAGTFTRTGLTSSAGNGIWPYCNVIRKPDNQPAQFSPGDIVTLQSPTWQGSLQLADVSWRVDTAADRVTGQAPTGDVEVALTQWYGEHYPARGSAVVIATAASPYTATFTGYDVRDGGGIRIRHFNPATNFATRYGSASTDWLTYQYFRVYLPGDILGIAPGADEAVTAHLYSAEGVELAATSDDHEPDPWAFRLEFPMDPGIQVGQWITLTSQTGWTAGLQVPMLTALAPSQADAVVRGKGPDALVMVDHTWEHEQQEWQTDRWFVPVGFAPPDEYAVNLSLNGAPVRKEDEINVIYQAPVGDQVGTYVVWPWMFVNYGRDTAGGVYAVDYQFDVTLMDSAGTQKATAQATTTYAGSMHDGTWLDGFLVEKPDWSPPSPDIVPGDVVLYQSDRYSNAVQVGTITGAIDAEADAVSGTIVAPWLASQTVQVIVGEWVFPKFREAPVVLNAAGRGDYYLDFSPADLPPEQVLTACYAEPDGDRVCTRVTTGRKVYLPVVLR
jgi:hypothetical protein